MSIDDLQTAKIENWYIAWGMLFGEVYGHPRFDDGHPVHTSTIVAYDKERGVVVTQNTVYTLEGPPRYEGGTP